jgi:hypothetical protein
MTQRVPALESTARAVLDAFPAPVFIADMQLVIEDMNQAAREFAAFGDAAVGRQLCGEVLRCARMSEENVRCGRSSFCRDCVIRQCVLAAGKGVQTVRQWCPMKLRVDGETSEITFLLSVSPFELAGRMRCLVVLEDVSEIVQLRRLLPTCSHCGKVRSDAQYWQTVQDYLRTYTSVQFTHGLCPDCLAELYGDEGNAISEEMDKPESP